VFEFDVPDDVKFIQICVFHSTSFITGIGMGYTYELDETAQVAAVSAPAEASAAEPLAEPEPSAAGETADWYTHMDGPVQRKLVPTLLDLVFFAGVAVVLVAVIITIVVVRRRRNGARNSRQSGMTTPPAPPMSTFCTNCGAPLPPDASFCTGCGKPRQQ
jgi:hypothetical protein